MHLAVDPVLEALQGAREYFEKRADEDYPPGQNAPVGNEEMHQMIEIDAAIALYKRRRAAPIVSQHLLSNRGH